MRRRKVSAFLTCLALIALTPQAAKAHITPPVVLVSEREAVVGMLAGATRFFAREVRLSTEERSVIQQQWRWKPEEAFYRFYLGRDPSEQLVAAVIFLTEFTIHGPVRVAVGVSPDGTIKGAAVVELTEETYPWLKPFLDQRFTRDYVGRGTRASFGLSERFGHAHGDSMPHFYAQIVASLIQRAAILYDVTFLHRTRSVS
jgi:hypothetical protein